MRWSLSARARLRVNVHRKPQGERRLENSLRQIKMIILWDCLLECSLEQSVCPPRVNTLKTSCWWCFQFSGCLTAAVSWQNHPKTNPYDFFSAAEPHSSHSHQVWRYKSLENWWWSMHFENWTSLWVADQSVISAFRVWCVQTTATHNSTCMPGPFIRLCVFYWRQHQSHTADESVEAPHEYLPLFYVPGDSDSWCKNDSGVLRESAVVQNWTDMSAAEWFINV